MRTSILRCAGFTSAAALLVLISRAPCLADGAPQQSSALNPKADDLVRKALQAEADGKPELRADYLKQALAADPNNDAAHWQSGEIPIGNRWLSVEAASKQAAHDGKVDEYRTIRDQTPATADDQLALARWCAKQNLKDQERTHLLYALQLNPKSKEIMSKLGLVRYQGTLVRAGELENAKEQVRAANAENREWKSHVAALKGRLSTKLDSTRSDVKSEIRAINDVDAITSLETAFAKSGADIGLAIVDSLKKMPEQQATDSLTRFAVLSQYEDVRQAATQALGDRSKFAYLPILLSGLQSPISFEYNVLGLSGHFFSDRITLFQEGPEQSNMAISARTAGFYSPLSVVGNGSAPTYVPPDTSPQKVAALASQQQQKAQNVRARVEQANKRTRAINERITAVLRSTTDQELGDDSVAWWDWWYDYNEYYRYPEKPKAVSSDTQFYMAYSPRVAYSVPPAPPPGSYRCECFVAGTPVWTPTGKMAIEAVKTGELVLSQNPETGELGYRPVFYTTVRPSSRLIEIHLGSTVIRVSRGHPLWVDGIGWQMAKELKAGQYLHTDNGPALIDTIEENGEETCYNLVVADFNTYFVSDAKVLVHDNNLRSPTAAIVPGLAQR